jgi:hypothetical protein
MEFHQPSADYGGRSGRFCGAVCPQGVIQETDDPSNDRYIG